MASVLLAVCTGIWGSVAMAGGCPNETQRSILGSTHLPDCRAYELVSPVIKDGQPVSARYMSPDGGSLIAESIGGFPGSNQESIFNFYEMARRPDGWETAPLNTPMGYVNPNATVLSAVAPDLGSAIFEYRPTTTLDIRDTGFYVNNLPAGTPVEIGPRLSPFALASNLEVAPIGASEPSVAAEASPSRLTFMLEGPSTITGSLIDYLWPGETTVVGNEGLGLDSLYEYPGTGNSTPALVGVDGKGDLISQCGTSLGFPEGARFTSLRGGGEFYNAMAADHSGDTKVSRAFFTAAGATQGPSEAACTEAGDGNGPPANELFVREAVEREGDPASRELHTIAISEPTEAEGTCTECNTKGPTNAVFQGASEDGEKVFFLSEQPLLPGAEGENLYEYDFGAEAGRRVVLIAHSMGEVRHRRNLILQGVARVSEDGSHIYFVAKSVLTKGKNVEGREPIEGENNLYVYSTITDQTTFIGTVAEADERDWQQEDIRTVDATPDGQFLVFTSSSTKLNSGDTGGIPQVFEYDAQTGTLALVSHKPNGNAEESEAEIASPEYVGSANPAPQPTSVSDDGSVVVFQGTSALTQQAAVGYDNVYEYNNGVISLISDGQDHNHGQDHAPTTRLVGVDGSGDDIFFSTADRLVPQDGDTQEDLYDARVNGGFLPPPGPATCEGEGCQGGLASPPMLGAPSSASLVPGEQVVEAPAQPTAKAKAKRVVKMKKSHGKARHSKAKGSRGKARGLSGISLRRTNGLGKGRDR